MKRWGYGSSIYNGVSQDILLKNNSENATWVLYGFDLATKVVIKITKVHYVNGNTYVITNKELTKFILLK